MIKPPHVATAIDDSKIKSHDPASFITNTTKDYFI